MKTLLIIFSLATIAATAFALVDLSHIEAVPGDQNVLFTWGTDTEWYNYFFEVRRNGVEIGHLTGYLNTTVPHEYSFRDTTCENESLYVYLISSYGGEGRDSLGGWELRPPHWVTLDTYHAYGNDLAISINWTAVCEIGNDYFDVLRDGVWIGSLNGHEHCMSSHYYTLGDSAVTTGQTYTYSLWAVHQDGRHDSLSSVTATAITSAAGESSLQPLNFNLSVYPNPFNPSTTVSFVMERSGAARLQVFDITGREVAVLVNGTVPAGAHRVVFDGSTLATGVYFLRLTGADRVETRKILLLK